MKKLFTLCVIHQHPRVLLGLKKRGLGIGKWAGFGGKIESGETIENAARREVCEEAGIEVGDIDKVGVLDFEFEGDPKILEVHVFCSTNFTGEPSESDEMKPQWYHIDEIPFSKMWPDNADWLPLLLAGKKFEGKFLLDGSGAVLKKDLLII